MINNGLNLTLEREHQDGTEWKFGALSQPGIVSIPPTERVTYLPLGRLQYDSQSDFYDCATRSPINHLEALFSYHYMHDMREENKAWLKEKGYIEGSRVVFSDRYISILAGTTREGNSLKKPIDTIHSQGLVPNSLLPQEDSMSFDDYYAGMTQQLKDLGQEFLTRFTINYEQVAKGQFQTALTKGMVGVAAYAWPLPVNSIYPRTSGDFNHAFLLYNLPAFQIFDNYYDETDRGAYIPGDFTKNIAPDYLFFDWGYRMYVSAESVPETPEQKTIVQQVYLALQKANLLQYFPTWVLAFLKL